MDKTANNFIHLNVHSQYTIGKSLSNVHNLIELAAANGMKGMALTDENSMSGIMEFSLYCDKINNKKNCNKEGIFKPVFGCDITIVDDLSYKGHPYQLILLAKDETGYENLVKLVSLSWTKGFYEGKPHIDKKFLAKLHNGLIACSAGLSGELAAKILEKDSEGALAACKWYHDLFGEDYYLELERHFINAGKELPDSCKGQEETLSKTLLDFSKETGVKVICTNAIYLEDKDMADAYGLWRKAGNNNHEDGSMADQPLPGSWFKSEEEMGKLFSDVPEALTNTMEILDKVKAYSIRKEPRLPNFTIPSSFERVEDIKTKYTKEKLLNEFLNIGKGTPTDEKVASLGGWNGICQLKQESDYLRYLTFKGARLHYGSPLAKEVKERIEYELKLIDFPRYYIIVQDYINHARKNLDALVGPGRGAAPSSIVNYCLGITSVDPLKYGLLPERYFRPEYTVFPDIDCDLDIEGKEKLENWLKSKYGKDNCAHVVSFSTISLEKAAASIAKALGFSLAQREGILRDADEELIHFVWNKDLRWFKSNGEYFLDSSLEKDDPIREVLKVSEEIKYAITGREKHPCGFVISPEPIAKAVPIYSLQEEGKKRGTEIVTQYDRRAVEDAGLVKFDLLSLNALSLLKKMKDEIKDLYGDAVDFEKIHMDDALTMELFQKGKTEGVFQFSSPRMQEYLKRLLPTHFMDLVALNALDRDGLEEYVDEFISRKQGYRKVSGIDYSILKETYGMIVFQEQVMLLSQRIANFNRGESDILRSAVGRKRMEILKYYKSKFLVQAQKNGYTSEFIESVWKDIIKYGAITFCKAHAVCYTIIGFWFAYIKAHYPDIQT